MKCGKDVKKPAVFHTLHLVLAQVLRQLTCVTASSWCCELEPQPCQLWTDSSSRFFKCWSGSHVVHQLLWQMTHTGESWRPREDKRWRQPPSWLISSRPSYPPHVSSTSFLLALDLLTNVGVIALYGLFVKSDLYLYQSR